MLTLVEGFFGDLTPPYSPCDVNLSLLLVLGVKVDNSWMIHELHGP